MNSINQTAPSIKLQAWISRQGITSRRKAEEMIEDKKVVVNGKIAHIGQRIDPEVDQVMIGGVEINAEEAAEKVYFLINKPPGVISTTNDELGRRNVTHLLPQEIREKYRLFPVGRLDMDSEGLMLLTNDGQLTNQLTHPSFEHKKTYKILVEGIPTDKALNHLERGIVLDDELVETDHLEILENENGNTWLEITVHQGKYHQVKRMMARVGYEVIKLIRTKFGPYSLEQLGENEFLQVEGWEEKDEKPEAGAGEGNRTLVTSLEN
jgi:23S rRNA pseudouridine2605 synthase